jgi:hypothetical protein
MLIKFGKELKMTENTKKSIRPVIEGINTISNKSKEEHFQNETLRPIIKLQHDLLVVYFKTYLISKKIQFKELSNLKKNEIISTAFKKDNAFKSELKGMILGHFTVEEFTVYSNFKSDCNKRILTMIEQRITSVIQLF